MNFKNILSNHKKYHLKSSYNIYTAQKIHF